MPTRKCLLHNGFYVFAYQFRGGLVAGAEKISGPDAPIGRARTPLHRPHFRGSGEPRVAMGGARCNDSTALAHARAPHPFTPHMHARPPPWQRAIPIRTGPGT